MPDPVTRDQIIAFVDSMPPDVKAKLVTCRDEQTALDQLDARIAALSQDGDAKRKQARTAFRAAREKQFGNFSWSKSLAGAPVEHTFHLSTVVKATLRPPTGEVQAAVNAWHSKMMADGSPLLPLTQAETVLLPWLTTLQGMQPTGPGNELPPVTDLTKVPYESRLQGLRKLPAQLLSRIASEALDLESWLSVVLEDELGNS